LATCGSVRFRPDRREDTYSTLQTPTHISTHSHGEAHTFVMSAPGQSLTLTPSRRRACTACQQAKRRCDQRLPRCGRCAQKGLNDCAYPALVDGGFPPVDVSLFADVLSAGSNADSLGSIIPVPVVSESENQWPLFFNSSGPANTAVTREAMVFCIDQFRSWPRRWVRENGMMPFIHPHLYLPSTGGVSGLPQSLQDAFCVCAAYAAKNDSNASLVLGIVEAKATALLYSPDQASWTLPQQLAALQSLLIFQMIRWFDGDIRQRALADAVEPVLAAWTTALQARVGTSVFEMDQTISALHTGPEAPQSQQPTAQQRRQQQRQQQQQQEQQQQHQAMFGTPDDRSAGSSLSPPHTHARNSPVLSTPSREDAITAWKRWLMNESIRRTTILAYLMRGIYHMAKQGYCKLGSVVSELSFTSQTRLWQATTADRWRRARDTEATWWVSRMDFSALLALADPADVDEFAVMLAVTYRGKDVVEDWMSQGMSGNPLMGIGMELDRVG
jgi:hypothetical protein